MHSLPIASTRLFFVTTALVATLALPACQSDGDPGGSGITNQGVGEACAATEECRAGLECSAVGLCAPAGTTSEGGLCELSGQCMDGLYCAADRTCSAAGAAEEGERCSDTGDCVSGLSCAVSGFYATCQLPGSGDLGDACATALDCLAGLSCAQNESLTFVCSSPSAATAGAALPPSAPYWAGADCPADGLPARAYFEVPRYDGADNDFYRLPFPNDIRRRSSGIDLRNHPAPDTALGVEIIDDYLRAAESDLEGFSTNPVVYFRFSQPYDWSTVAGALRFVNIDAESSEYGARPGAAWLTTAGRITKYICDNWLAVRPSHGAPLLPGTTYALIVTDALTPDPDNSPSASFRADSDFSVLLADEAPDDATLATAWEAYAPLRAYLADLDDAPDPSSILAAAVFTTQPARDYGALRAAVRADDVPTLHDVVECGAGVTSPCDDGGESRTCEGGSDAYTEYQGRIRLPIFQEGNAPYLTPADGGGFVEEGGVPVIQRHEDVCFSLTVPSGDAPAEGWPLLLALHGTGGSYRTAVLDGLAAEVAATTAADPSGGDDVAVAAATLAIDLPEHGERRGESTESPEVLFYNFLNPRAARDNVAQGAADLFALLHFATGGPASADAFPSAITFDSTRIVVFAHSQGANHAALAVPYESDLAGVVFSGLGADLTLSLLNKRAPIDIAGALPYALLDADGSGALSAGDFHPMLALWQGYFDGVDSVNHARHLYRAVLDGRTPAHLMMTYGSNDSYAPDATLRSMARAALFPEVPSAVPALDCSTPLASSQADGNTYCSNQLGPYWACDAESATCTLPLGLPSASLGASANARAGDFMITAGLRVYPADDFDGHFVARRSEAGRADTTRFLVQALAGLAPQVGE